MGKRELLEYSKQFIECVKGVTEAHPDMIYSLLNKINEELDKFDDYPKLLLSPEFAVSVLEILKTTEVDEIRDLCMHTITQFIIMDQISTKEMLKNGLFEVGMDYFRRTGFPINDEYVLFLSFICKVSSKISFEILSNGQINTLFSALTTLTDIDTIRDILNIPSFAATLGIGYDNALFLLQLLKPNLKRYENDEETLIVIFSSFTFLLIKCPLLKNFFSGEIIDKAIDLLMNEVISDNFVSQLLWFLSIYIGEDMTKKREILTQQFFAQIVGKMSIACNSFSEMKWLHVFLMMMNSTEAATAFVNSGLFDKAERVISHRSITTTEYIVLIYSNLISFDSEELYEICLTKEPFIDALKDVLQSATTDKENLVMILDNLLDAAKLMKKYECQETSFIQKRWFFECMKKHSEESKIAAEILTFIDQECLISSSDDDD